MFSLDRIDHTQIDTNAFGHTGPIPGIDFILCCFIRLHNIHNYTTNMLNVKVEQYRYKLYVGCNDLNLEIDLRGR